MNQTINLQQQLLAGATSLAFIVLPYQIAEAATIGLLGTNSNAALTSFLQTNGYSVVDLNVPTPSFTGLDSVILLRNVPTGATSTNLRNFVLNGGQLITEQSGADWALGNTSGNLLNADVITRGTAGFNTSVTFTAAGISSGLAAGINNPYADGTRTETFLTIGNIGAGVSILATRPGATPTIPAIIGGASGSGSTLVIAYDWADDFANANADTQQLILNALPPSTIPEPATILGILAFGLAGLATTRKGS